MWKTAEMTGAAGTLPGEGERLGRTERLMDSARHMKDRAVESLHRGRDRADRMVVGHPLSSLMLVFSVGMAIGVALGIVAMRSSEPQPAARMWRWWNRGRETAGDWWSGLRR